MTQKIAWVATQPGRHTLPALEIRWWDTQSNRLQTAALPALTVDVAPAPGGDTAAPAPIVMPRAVAATETHADESVIAVPGADAMPWRTLSVFLFAGWALTAMSWLWKARLRQARPAPATSVSRQPPALAPAVRNVTEACRTADAKTLRQALLDYAAARWSEAPPRNLYALAAHAKDDRTRQALLLVERRLYGRNGEQWPAKAVCAEIARWVSGESEAPTTPAPPRPLQELFPKPESRS
jgi:hypothetical protein